MSDNLFDRLFELFQTSDIVNWGLSEEIVKSVAGERQPIEPQLAEEYQELALAAHLQLASSGSLDAGGGVIPDPIDAAGWALANHRSFAYLMEPLATAMSGGSASGNDPLAAMMGPLGPALSGMQAGSMVGFMSHRVLGQFDTWLPALDQEKAYLVVPNVESFASEHSLDPRQVRLWATMHELLRHATLRRESVRPRLVRDVADLVSGIDLDPSRLMEKLGELRDPAGLEAVLGDSEGLAGLLGGERDEASAAGLEATAAFIAGHGDYVVERAAGSMLPELGAITAAYEARRTEPQEQADQMQQFVGLDVDRARAGDGTAFCTEVTRRWGDEALARVWDAPGNFPDASELTDPIGWAARVLLD